MKDIENFNSKGEFHGYQEVYWLRFRWYRGFKKNGKQIGYQEWHGVKETIYYIK